jgi:hypothetical protein
MRRSSYHRSDTIDGPTLGDSRLLYFLFKILMVSLTSAGRHSLTTAPAPVTFVNPCRLSCTTLSSASHALTLPASPFVLALSSRNCCRRFLVHSIVSSGGCAISLTLGRERRAAIDVCSGLSSFGACGAMPAGSGDDAGARFHDEFMTARRASLEVRSCGFL